MEQRREKGLAGKCVSTPVSQDGSWTGAVALEKERRYYGTTPAVPREKGRQRTASGMGFFTCRMMRFWMLWI